MQVKLEPAFGTLVRLYIAMPLARQVNQSLVLCPSSGWFWGRKSARRSEMVRQYRYRVGSQLLARWN